MIIQLLKLFAIMIIKLLKFICTSSVQPFKRLSVTIKQTKRNKETNRQADKQTSKVCIYIDSVSCIHENENEI